MASFKNLVGAERYALSEFWHSDAGMNAWWNAKNCGFNSSDQYDAFCTAKDWLQDTNEAIQSLIARDFDSDPMRAYVEFWGMLQALVVQQDAILELCYSVGGNQLKQNVKAKMRNKPAWIEIRDLRNLAVGHPNKQNSNNIIRRSVTGRQPKSISCLSLTVYTQNGTCHKNIDLTQKIAEYDFVAAPVVRMCRWELKKKLGLWP